MIIIKTTTNNTEIRDKIINTLIKKKYAACINIIENVTSYYMWNDNIEKDTEYMLLIKTIIKHETIIYNTINELHNYDIPEISTLSVANVSEDYNKWLLKSVSNDLQ